MAMGIVSTYVIKPVGDGASVTLEVDLNDQIQADATIHNKMPIEILSIFVSSNAVPPPLAPAGALNGTVVTLDFSSFSSPLGNGQVYPINIEMKFNGA